MNDMETLIARDNIRQLAQRYAIALDRREIDSLVKLFVQDVQVGRTDMGREALKAQLTSSLRQLGVSILHVTNHAIDFSGEHNASGVVYCMAETQQGDDWVRQAICYEDEYRKEEGDWLFVRRKHRLWYAQAMTDNPMELDTAANESGLAEGRGSIPQRWNSWQAFFSSHH